MPTVSRKSLTAPVVGAMTVFRSNGLGESEMKIEDAEKIIEGFEELQKIAAPVATRLIELQEGIKEEIEPDEITIEYGDLYAKWTEWGRCGDYDERSTLIPLDYLFDENWMAKAGEEIRRKREEKAEKERLAKLKEEEAKRNRELNQYLKLKEKYEGEKS